MLPSRRKEFLALRYRLVSVVHSDIVIKVYIIIVQQEYEVHSLVTILLPQSTFYVCVMVNNHKWKEVWATMDARYQFSTSMSLLSSGSVSAAYKNHLNRCTRRSCSKDLNRPRICKDSQCSRKKEGEGYNGPKP